MKNEVAKAHQEDTESQKKMDKVSRWDDIKVVIAVVFITLIAVIVVTVKSAILFEEVINSEC